MATIMEHLGLLEFFLPVFSLLFVFVVCYAILAKTKILGKSPWTSLTAAFAISMLFFFTPELMDLVKITTPWFVIFLIFLVLVFATFMFLGLKPEVMTTAVENPTVHWTILIVIVLIFVVALTQVFGSPVQQIYGEGETEEPGGILGDVGGVIFHPRVLGALFILLVASQAIRLIGTR